MSKQDLYVVLGSRIRDARRDLGLTIEEVAQKSKLGLSRSAISTIEQGKQKIYVHQLLQLSRALGLKPEKIISDLAEMSSSTVATQSSLKDDNELNSKVRSFIENV